MVLVDLVSEQEHSHSTAVGLIAAQAANCCMTEKELAVAAWPAVAQWMAASVLDEDNSDGLLASSEMRSMSFEMMACPQHVGCKPAAGTCVPCLAATCDERQVLLPRKRGSRCCSIGSYASDP